METYIRDESSRLTIGGEVQLFTPPETIMGFNRSLYQEFKPTNPLDSPPYNIDIPYNQNFYDFRQHILITAWRGTIQEAGQARRFIAVGDNVSLVNGFGAVWPKDLFVLLNQKETHKETNYSHKNYLDILLSYTPEAKKSHLAMIGWYDDGDTQNAGTGFESRRGLITDGKIAEFGCRINTPLFNTDKILVNNTELSLKIYPQSAQFLFIAPNVANDTILRLELMSMSLWVKRRDLSDSLAMNIQNRLKSGQSVMYSLRNHEIKTIYAEQGRTFIDVNVVTGPRPRRCIVCTFDRADFDGVYTSSPFTAKHHDKRTLQFSSNGEQVPHISYDMSYADNNERFVRPYFDMMDACGFAFSPNTNGITMKMFKNGYNIYVVNLTRSLDDHKEFDVVVHGTTNLRIDFSQPIGAGGITVLVSMEYDQLLKINHDRVVTTDLMA